MANTIKINGVIAESSVDGAGLRYVIFTQGCPHNCTGCHNEQTHSFSGGNDVDIFKIYSDIISNPLLSGVTISGGEPFMQAESLLPLAKLIKEKGLNIAIYSGFTFEQLLNMDACCVNLLSFCDILVDGKFVLAERSLSLKFKGSKNQRILSIKQSLTQNTAVLDTSSDWN